MSHVCDKCGKAVLSLGLCADCRRKFYDGPLAWLWRALVLIVLAILAAIINSCLSKMGLSE